MYGFTFEKEKGNEPIAITDEGDILYIANYKNIKKKVPKEYVLPVDVEKYNHLFNDFKGKQKTKIKNDVRLLFFDPEAIEYIESDASKYIYRKIRETEKAFKPVTKIDIDEDTFTIYPSPHTDIFQCLFICGQSGSGKSTVSLRYVEQYKKIFPKNDVYLISSLDKDKTLDKNKDIIRLNLETFLQQPPTIDEFKDSLVIMDDYETLKYTDKKMYKILMALLAQLISKGRHTNTRIIVCRHKFQNTGDEVGQLVISESTHYILYPKTCSRENMKLIFGKHGTLNNKQINDLYSLPSRWVCYVKNFPPFILTENSCWLIHP